MPETQGGSVKYFPEDKDLFAEGTSEWAALNQGFELVMNSHGMGIDAWHPTTKKQYEDAFDASRDERLIGTRDTTYTMPEAIKDVKDVEHPGAELEDLADDMMAETRSITTMRLGYDWKNKRYRDLLKEKARRKREESGQGYERRYYIPKRYPVYTYSYRYPSTATHGVFKT